MAIRLIAAACLGAILVAQVAPADIRQPPATRPATSQSNRGFAGEWDTSYGPMTLTQHDRNVDGGYGPKDQRATLHGTLEGKRLTFTYVEPNARGDGWFELSEDGKSFHGKWREAGTQQWNTWEGTRQSSHDPFTGLWHTDFGRMRLWQTGDRVRGVYEFSGRSTLTGQVKNNTLHFHYDQADGETGEASFTLSADRDDAFEGTWKSSAGPHGQAGGRTGQWKGTRILAQAGTLWLVVFEAPWEANLAEQEYSFGLMLRTYFARVPSVHVHHRFFYTEKDLRQLCAELPYLAEPVVLHISSHGSTQGVSAGGETIGAKTLAECLRDAGDLRLVHFGSCQVAGGDIPDQIFRLLGPEARFPISGYRNVADWAGSAVVDFTYLELVLARNTSPVVAIEQTRKMLTFARDSDEAGAPIPATGLVIHQPPDGKGQRE